MQRTITPVEQLQEYYNKIYQEHCSIYLNKVIESLHVEILGLNTFLKINLVLLRGGFVNANIVNTECGGDQRKISRLLSEIKIALDAYETRKSDDEFYRAAENQFIRLQNESLSIRFECLPASAAGERDSLLSVKSPPLKAQQTRKPTFSFLNTIHSFFCCTSCIDPENDSLANNPLVPASLRESHRM